MRRRDFLRASGVGLAAGLLPRLSSVAGAACGEGVGGPKRLVIFYTLHGAVYDRWRIRPPEAEGRDSWDVPLAPLTADQFSDSLRPLHRWRERMTVVDGLSLLSAVDERRRDVNCHTLGHVHSLSARHTTAEADPDDPDFGRSVDQIIGGRLAGGVRRPSVEFALGNTGEDRALWAGVDLPVPAERSPARAWERLFGGMGGAAADPVAESERRLARAVQGSVLDLVAGRYAALARQLSGGDARKLEAHGDLVRDLERQIAALSELTCEAPELGDSAQPYASPGWYEAGFDAFAGLTTALLSCDLTRVVTLLMGQLENAHIGAPAGDVHTEFAHRVGFDARADDIMTRYSTTHAEQFARLLAALDGVPDPDGDGSLLDHTAVLWAGELADGPHNFDVWPVVLAGGACGAFRMGRHLRLAPEILSPQALGPRLLSPPHSRFLRSLCAGMGAAVDHVGNRSAIDQDGGAIDLTAPLPGLLA